MRAADDHDFYLGLLRAYLDSTADAIFVLCDEMKFLLCNRVAERWFGQSEATLTCHNRRIPLVELLVEPIARERFRSHFQTALTGTPQRLETQLGDRWVELLLNRVGLAEGDMVICVGRDMTERRGTEERLRLFSRVIEQTTDLVCISDRAGVIQYVNPGFERATGYTRAEAVGQRTNHLRSGHQNAAFYEHLWSTIEQGQAFRSLFVNRRKDGSVFHEEKTITPLKDERGEITHFVSTGKDVTERALAQDKLNHLAFHDALTGLPNRLLFRDRLEQALTRAEREDRLVALLFLDLDRFKDVNDTLGHAAGDGLLQAAARRLRECVRQTDTVARLGGDEFTVIAEGLTQPDQAGTLAQNLLAEMARPFETNGRELFVTASAGIAVYPLTEQDADCLIQHADTAMYHAKQAGRNNYQFYSADMTARVAENFALATDLRRALEREEFAIHYQPIVELASGRCSGVEALLRWRLTDGSYVSPDKFVPVAEESGLIVPIGRWLLCAACRDRQAWRAAGLDGLTLSLNISGRQLNDPGFLRSFRACLGSCLLGSGTTEVEITESSLIGEPKAIGAALRDLKAQGVRIALDDFGTGYSSLSHLQRFPIDTLKIDRSFVAELPRDRQARALVGAVVAMGRNLGVRVVAEGVETEAQLAFLRDCGCDAAQGYLFSEPLSADELPTRLASLVAPKRGQP